MSFKTFGAPPPMDLSGARTWNTNAHATGLTVIGNTNGLTCSVSLVYSTHADLSSALTKLIDGRFIAQSATALNPSIEGLQPNTTYYYQFVGANGPTLTKTPVQSFKTTAQ
jgi:phosphodiesterase/alkaline phosphatase D-like protein